MSISNLVKQSLVMFLEWRKVKAVKSKTSKICKNLDRRAVSELAGKWDIGYLRSLRCRANRDLIAAYALLSGVKQGPYIPEDIYYNKIEPALNNRLYALAYADKNSYEKLLGNKADIFPRTLLRRVNGTYLTSDYGKADIDSALKIISGMDTDIIAKPSVETSGGNSVLKATYEGGYFLIEGKSIAALELIELLDKRLGSNYIIQELIRQHTWFEGINPSSINTVRFMAYRSVVSDEAHAVSAVLRFGMPGNIVDNQAAGGMTCGISPEGILNNFSVDKYGVRRSDWPWLLERAGTPVPGYSDMLALTKKLMTLFPYHRVIGFDFCVDECGRVLLIEANLKNLEVNFLQMNNGPLFGEFTSEIIDYCSSHCRSFMVGFYA